MRHTQTDAPKRVNLTHVPFSLNEANAIHRKNQAKWKEDYCPGRDRSPHFSCLRDFLVFYGVESGLDAYTLTSLISFAMCDGYISKAEAKALTVHFACYHAGVEWISDRIENASHIPIALEILNRFIKPLAVLFENNAEIMIEESYAVLNFAKQRMIEDEELAA